jgi:hypothetical protein
MLFAFAHTNVEWYPYKEQGSFFRLVRGELEYMPMRVDGSMVVEDIALVDFDRIDKEGLQPLQANQERTGEQAVALLRAPLFHNTDLRGMREL